METLLENIRASAILMKNLPSTQLGDALLISREEARRIGYELEACVESIEKARATPALPQGVEEWADTHGVRASLFDPDVLCVAVCDLMKLLSGVESLPISHARRRKGESIVTPEIGKRYNWRGQPERLIYRGKAGRWHQFALVGMPEKIWCEVLDADLHMIEETALEKAYPSNELELEWYAEWQKMPGQQHFSLQEYSHYAIRKACDWVRAHAPTDIEHFGEVAAGDSFDGYAGDENGGSIHTAGINVGKWGNRIEIYGGGKNAAAEAEVLRDIVLSALTMRATPALPQGDEYKHAKCPGHDAYAASQALPQGVEEWIDSAQVQLGDESPTGWGNYIPSSEARAYLPDMAIVPVDTINKALHGLEHLKADIQARSKMQEDYQEGVVMVGAGAWHGLCSAILMLAAAKEKQS